MSDRYESKEDLFDKCDWEGGPTSFILGYGLSAEQLPEGTPQHVVNAVNVLNDAKNALSTFEEWLYEGEEL